MPVLSVGGLISQGAGLYAVKHRVNRVGFGINFYADGVFKARSIVNIRLQQRPDFSRILKRIHQFGHGLSAGGIAHLVRIFQRSIESLAAAAAVEISQGRLCAEIQGFCTAFAV